MDIKQLSSFQSSRRSSKLKNFVVIWLHWKKIGGKFWNRIFLLDLRESSRESVSCSFPYPCWKYCGAALGPGQTDLATGPTDSAPWTGQMGSLPVWACSWAGLWARRADSKRRWEDSPPGGAYLQPGRKGRGKGYCWNGLISNLSGLVCRFPPCIWLADGINPVPGSHSFYSCNAGPFSCT